jgi:hypothetical protein
MEFKKLKIKALSKQALSKMKRGLPARLMAGEGMQISLMSHKFDAAAKAFLKNKGINMALSVPEVEENTMSMTSVGGKDIYGEGIFGKKADKFFEKKGIKKVIYKTGAALKPLAMEAIDAAAVAATAYGVPPSVVALAQKETKGYIDNPDKYQTKKGQNALLKRVGKTATEVASPYLEEAGIDVQQVKDSVKLAKAMKKSAPGGAPAPSAASLKGDAEEAFLSTLQAYMDKRAASKAPVQSTSPYDLMDTDGIIGNGIFGPRRNPAMRMGGVGLYAGAAGRGLGMGLYSGSGMCCGGEGIKSRLQDIGKKYVNSGRSMVGMGHPALDSQALDANFAFRNQMPPAYQRKG